MRAVGVQVEQKLGCVFADAQIAHGLAVFGVEMLADGGISDVVIVVVLFQAVGNNSCKKCAETSGRQSNHKSTTQADVLHLHIRCRNATYRDSTPCARAASTMT